jgi:D-aminopeptidase
MNRPRARELGWLPPAGFECGPHNALTDIPGVWVGHATLIQGGPGPLVVGKGPVRTGVTAIRPHPGNLFDERVAAGVHVLNGFGKTVGLEQVQELGILETPILLTNTLNVWRCADALLDWMLQANPEIGISQSSLNPLIGECNDGWLNDIQGRHVTREQVFLALNGAAADNWAEGCIGAGTGTLCYQFKGGIGTASRVLPPESGGFRVGVLLQANFGSRHQLLIRGKAVGRALQDWQPEYVMGAAAMDPVTEDGSCMVILATDAPLDSRQLTRLARRAPLGLARTGFTSNPGSGDYVIAFSTANRRALAEREPTRSVSCWVDEGAVFGHLLQAVVEAVEEAVLNALAAADTMVGRDRHLAPGIPIDIIQELLRA